MPPATLPAAPAAPNLNAIPGESVDQYEARLGAQSTKAPGAGFGTPVPAQPVTDLNTAHDEVAKQLGFSSYSDALSQLSTPSSDTEKFYNDAYAAAGLNDLSNKIASRQSDLNTATGKINDNPWLDEASRVGRVRNLTTLANADIKNLQAEYNTKLQSVHDLVTQHADELKTTTANNKAKLVLLESQAKGLAAQAATTAKTQAAPPKTIKGPNSTTFQWNPSTNSFDKILSGSASTSPTKPQTSDITSMHAQLSAVRGTDGYISPQDWATAKQAWVSAGYSSSVFNSTFSAYKNPHDKYN